MLISARWRVWIALTVVVLAGLLGGLLARPFGAEIHEQRLSGLEWAETPAVLPAAPETGSLPLRLVDMGGVGIPADTAAWGHSYSHATHAFDQLILDGPPWLDPAGADAVREDWRAYVARMARMGSNAVILDAFLELVTFDGLGSGTEVYPDGDPLRPRHLAYRAFFGELVADARTAGMEVYLKTDLPVATPELRGYLAGLDAGLDTGRPEFWSVYAAALEEVFDQMPGVAGVVVRIGEAGPLYQADGVEYSSWMGVREPAQLQVMLRTLLPVFEARDRTLIFRTWSVGVGPLGDLHNDPAVYEAVLGPIRSDALILSTKFVRGDYFGFLPLNPTLLVGTHERIIEYQARREYEGFGALPNYLGPAHAAALRQVLAANPHVVGTSIWAQEGGPLRAGPLSLYDVTGFWRWTDANVYATTRLTLDPAADPVALSEDWARETFGDDPETARGMARILATSREAMEKGLYIRPYARQRVEVVGVDAPPILWVFEWDVVAGWSSVLAAVYRAVADDVETPIAEGFEAVALTRSMRETLRSLAPRIGGHPDYPAMLRSLDYQESLFGALADYRESFLRYHAWLEHGGDPGPWRAAARRFLGSGRAHVETFGADLDFPAFDVGPALRATERALGEGGRTWTARVLAGLLLLTFVLGASWFQRRTPAFPGKGVARLVWIGASRPYRLAGRLGRGRWAPWLLAGVILAGAVACVTLLLASPTAVALGVSALGLGYMATLARSWRAGGAGSTPWAEAPAALGPGLLAALLILSVTAVRGPDYFWFLFWTREAFRAVLFAVVIGMGLWAVVSSHWTGHALSGGRGWFAGGSVLTAAGLMLLVLSGLLPDLEGTLAALDDPFQLLPMRRAIINGITHYAGVSGSALFTPGVVGGGLLLLGLVMRGRDRRPEGGPGPENDP